MDVHRASPTVAEYASRWFDTHCAPPFRAHYVRRTRISSLNLYVLPSIGALPLNMVTTAVLSELQRKLFAKGLKQATIRTAIGHFAELWKSARADGLVHGRPHVDLVWPRIREPKPTVFTPSERDRVVRLAFEKRLWFAPQVGLMFMAGLRPSEAAGIRIHDLDPTTGQLEITQAIVGHERTEGKTRKSLRSIMLPRQLVQMLVEFQRARDRTRGYMSANRNGNPVHTAVFGTNWKALLREAQVPYRAPYAMRHTYITLALMSGASPAQVAEYCATSIQMIEKSYLSWIGAVQDPMHWAQDSRRVKEASPQRRRAHARPNPIDGDDLGGALMPLEAPTFIDWASGTGRRDGSGR